MDSPYVPIGERIAIYRRRRGLSQIRLGGLIDRSENWVSKVERGRMPVDRISVLIRIADALHVDLADLLRDLRNGDPGHRVVDQDVNALRAALLRIPPATDLPPRDLDVLAAELDSVSRLREKGRYADGLAAVPGLLGELHAAADVHDGGDRTRALRLLTHGYGLAARTLNRYGATDAAWVAVDRAALLAEQTGHPGDRAHSVYWMAHVLLGAGQPADAIAVAERGIERARTDASAGGLPSEVAGEVRALMGAVHLPLAVSAARQGDRGVVWQALGEADSLARDGRAGVPAWVEMWTQYSANNVLLHRVSCAVDLGDAGDALRLAEQVDATALRPARYSRHLIDVALANSYRRKTEGMVGALERAERVAPEQLHNFPLVREMVYGALRRERGHAYRSLHTLADRIGVT